MLLIRKQETNQSSAEGHDIDNQLVASKTVVLLNRREESGNYSNDFLGVTMVIIIIMSHHQHGYP